VPENARAEQRGLLGWPRLRGPQLQGGLFGWLVFNNLVSPSHIVFLVPQHACVTGCMLRVTYMTQTSSLRHVHVLNSVHRCFMLDTMNTGAQPSVTLFEFVGVRMSVFVTVGASGVASGMQEARAAWAGGLAWVPRALQVARVPCSAGIAGAGGAAEVAGSPVAACTVGLDGAKGWRGPDTQQGLAPPFALALAAVGAFGS
jgi:hypothetical protein